MGVPVGGVGPWPSWLQGHALCGGCGPTGGWGRLPLWLAVQPGVGHEAAAGLFPLVGRALSPALLG